MVVGIKICAAMLPCGVAIRGHAACVRSRIPYAFDSAGLTPWGISRTHCSSKVAAFGVVEASRRGFAASARQKTVSSTSSVPVPNRNGTLLVASVKNRRQQAPSDQRGAVLTTPGPRVPRIDIGAFHSVDGLLDVGLREKLAAEDIVMITRRYLELASMAPRPEPGSRMAGSVEFLREMKEDRPTRASKMDQKGGAIIPVPEATQASQRPSRFALFLKRGAGELCIGHRAAVRMDVVIEFLKLLPECTRFTESDAVAEVAFCLGEAAAKSSRNSLSPRQFAALMSCLAETAKRQCQQSSTIKQFFVRNAVELMPEFGPRELITMLSCVQAFQVYDQFSLDFIVERIVDESHRFSGADVVTVLARFAQMGLIRAQAIQQLSKTALGGACHLRATQITSLAVSLAQLRYIGSADFMALLDLLRHDRTGVCLHQVIFAATLVELANPVVLVPLIDRELSRSKDIKQHPFKMAAILYTVLFYNLPGALSKVNTLLPQLLNCVPLGNPFVVALMSEILTACQQCYPEVALNPSMRLINAIKSNGKDEAVKWEGLKILAELNDAMQSLPCLMKVPVTRGALAGPYFAQFSSSEHKLVVHLETPHDTTDFRLRQAHLQKLGYATVLIRFWQWKRLRNPKNRADFLHAALTHSLVKVGVLGEAALKAAVERRAKRKVNRRKLL